MIEIEHNFDPRKFRWLFAKYVQGINDRYHCTNCIRGPYSRLFTKHNPSFAPGTKVLMDELPPGQYEALYICGVAAKGYRRGQNYPHNVHVAIAPLGGSHETWNFENWTMEIMNGRLLKIPESVEEIPIQYRKLPPEFTTCRIFRWATSFQPGI
jgi:hypothetical protein